MKIRLHLLFLLVIGVLITSCSIVENIAPPPAATEIPTPKNEDPTPTPEPTLGEPEYISAVYCWESHIDDGEYNLIRFFPSGNLIDIYASLTQAVKMPGRGRVLPGGGKPEAVQPRHLPSLRNVDRIQPDPAQLGRSGW